MLKVVIPASEKYDSANNLFIYTKEQTLQLEHSLVSIAKWETKWKKPFFSEQRKGMTEAQAEDYVRCMTLTKNVDPVVYRAIPKQVWHQIHDYINDQQSAYPQPKPQGGGGTTLITSDLIYYWMISYNIPMECQKWHLNRLLTLINICNRKNGSGKKMSNAELAAQNRAINAARRAQLHSKG